MNAKIDEVKPAPPVENAPKLAPDPDEFYQRLTTRKDVRDLLTRLAK